MQRDSSEPRSPVDALREGLPCRDVGVDTHHAPPLVDGHRITGGTQRPHRGNLLSSCEETLICAETQTELGDDECLSSDQDDRNPERQVEQANREADREFVEADRESERTEHEAVRGQELAESCSGATGLSPGTQLTPELRWGVGERA